MGLKTLPPIAGTAQGTWCSLGWVTGMVVSRDMVQLPATATRARLLMTAELETRRGAEQQCSTQLEEVGRKFPVSAAQVEFPEGINLLEKEPGLDISYNFLTISSSECAAQKKFKQRTTEETHCWPDCQQVPSMSSFSVFLFSVSKC